MRGTEDEHRRVEATDTVAATRPKAIGLSATLTGGSGYSVSPLRNHPASAMTIEYTPEQVEFGRAMERFKRFSGRYPTWADVLRVAKKLGYVKCSCQEGLNDG